MNLKIFSLLIFCFSVTWAFGQNNQAMRVTPSPYPDTVNKPAVVETGYQKITEPGMNVRHESITASPSTLSIGRASAVITQERQSSMPADVENNAAVKYNEQKVEKQEVPVNNSSLNPK